MSVWYEIKKWEQFENNWRHCVAIDSYVHSISNLYHHTKFYAHITCTCRKLCSDLQFQPGGAAQIRSAIMHKNKEDNVVSIGHNANEISKDSYEKLAKKSELNSRSKLRETL